MVNSARGENEIRGRVKNLGLKVFTDARQPVTLEEGDRYPLRPPLKVFVKPKINRCFKLKVYRAITAYITIEFILEGRL